MTPEETALLLIRNAGFRDSRVIPTTVVKGLLVEALQEAKRSEARVAELLADFNRLQTPTFVVQRQPQRVLRRKK